MARHLIVGAGPVGTSVARHLLAAGHDVVVATRSGTRPPLLDVDAVAVDASDAERLTSVARGAASIYNCANPAYHRWATDWPPIAAALLDAAEAVGARLVTTSNLYGFARGGSPMQAVDPLDPPSRKGAVRVAMWQDALARHEQGRVQVTEVRGSDFVGPGLGEGAHLGSRFVDAILRGRSPRIVGPPDVVHSWTYVDDMAHLLAIAGTDDRALGRAWHAPTLAARTAQEMADTIADGAGVSRVAVRTLPRPVLTVAGWFSPVVREVREVRYQFDEPFVIDSTDSTETFGLAATPLEAQVRAIIGGSPAEVRSSGLVIAAER